MCSCCCDSRKDAHGVCALESSSLYLVVHANQSHHILRLSDSINNYILSALFAPGRQYFIMDISRNWGWAEIVLVII